MNNGKSSFSTWGQMTFEEAAEVLRSQLTRASRYRYGLAKLRDRLGPCIRRKVDLHDDRKTRRSRIPAAVPAAPATTAKGPSDDAGQDGDCRASSSHSPFRRLAWREPAPSVESTVGGDTSFQQQLRRSRRRPPRPTALYGSFACRS